MEPILGIDLGTSYTVTSVVEKGRARIIPNRQGERLTPSIYTQTAEGLSLVGTPAREQGFVNAKATISSIKRHMGSEKKINIGGRLFSPEAISSQILKKVKADAEHALNSPVSKAVITVPAYFHHGAREATRKAAEMAGFDVLRILSEPTAAALAYGLHRQDESRIVVWDLGGGTFDVSILTLSDDFFEVEAVCGDNRLGGDDWDQRLADSLTPSIESCFKRPADPELKRQILRAAEMVKQELSNKPVAPFVLTPPPLLSGAHHSFRQDIRRSDFDAITADLVERLIGPTRQALKDARLSVNHIDKVLLVGGSTRMPAVRKAAQALFLKPPCLDINPDEVVAIGAAVQAGILSGQITEAVLVDVTPLSLGIASEGGLFTRIIPRNTTIPTSKRQIFTTAKNDQTNMDIHVLQGERDQAKENREIGVLELTGIPPLQRGQSLVEICFAIDADGIVKVTAQNLHTEEESSLTVSSNHHPSQEEIDEALEEAERFAEKDLAARDQAEAITEAHNLIQTAEDLLDQIEHTEKKRLIRHLETYKKSVNWADAPTLREKSTALRAHLLACRPFDKVTSHETHTHHNAASKKSNPSPPKR